MARTAILIPSLGRSQHVRRTYANIEANTPEPHIQMWCAGEPEYFTEFDQIEDPVSWLNDTDSDDKRYVTRMNKLAKAAVAMKCEYVFFGSDDVIHHPHWLSKALEIMEEAENCSVVVVNDLRNPNGTQAVVRTEYLPLAVFDDPEAAFHDGYQHNFADTEMFQTAAQRGVIYRANESHVEHLHPLHRGSNQREWDDTYAHAQSQWHVDSELYHERMVAMKEALS